MKYLLCVLASVFFFPEQSRGMERCSQALLFSVKEVFPGHATNVWWSYPTTWPEEKAGDYAKAFFRELEPQLEVSSWENALQAAGILDHRELEAESLNLPAPSENRVWQTISVSGRNSDWVVELALNCNFDYSIRPGAPVFEIKNFRLFQPTVTVRIQTAGRREASDEELRQIVEAVHAAAQRIHITK